MKQVFRKIRDIGRAQMQVRALQELASASTRRIVVGSSGTRLAGWVSTDRETLDLLEPETWARYFSPGSIDAILAEHVWEHLTPEAALVAAKTCHRFLKTGGYLRIGIPDGKHPDPSYIESVRPGGTGPGADDHKVLYTHASARALFETAGFSVNLYEFFDDQGQFQFTEWDPAGGMIHRSKRFDERNTAKPLSYTSIVLDALKP